MAELVCGQGKGIRAPCMNPSSVSEGEDLAVCRQKTLSAKVSRDVDSRILLAPAQGRGQCVTKNTNVPNQHPSQGGCVLWLCGVVLSKWCLSVHSWLALIPSSWVNGTQEKKRGM